MLNRNIFWYVLNDKTYGSRKNILSTLQYTNMSHYILQLLFN